MGNKVLSEEHKRKISEAGRGKPKSPETRERMRLAALHRGAEHKRRISEGLVGNQNAAGRRQTDEERQRHREGALRSIENGYRPWENFGTLSPEVRHNAALKREARLREGREESGQIWRGYHVEARIRAYIRSAEKRQLEWNISRDEARLLLTSPCYYCNTRPPSPRPGGIDRLDNGMGYVSGNCVSCCKWCNYGKNVRSEQEFLAHCIEIAWKHGKEELQRRFAISTLDKPNPLTG